MFVINNNGFLQEFTKDDSITGKRFAAIILTFDDVSQENRKWLTKQVLNHVTGSTDLIRQVLSEDDLCASLRRSLKRDGYSESEENQLDHNTVIDTRSTCKALRLIKKISKHILNKLIEYRWFYDPESAKTFSSSIYSLIDSLEYEEAPLSTYNILINSFEELQHNYVCLRLSLPKHQAGKLKNMWDEYSAYSNRFGDEWEDYKRMNHFGEYLSQCKRDESTVRKLAIERLTGLLNFCGKILK
jgi:hypothetical protein